MASRRLFLQLGGVAVAGALGALIHADAAHTPDNSFVRLRRRWREVTAQPYGTKAVGYRDAMAPADGSLWPDLVFPSFTETPARLQAMAREYAVTGDASLATAVATGIDHYRQRVYTAGADPAGNWWDWEIGVPRRLLDAAVLIGPHLTEKQSMALRDAVDHFLPESRLDDYSGTSTGANRVDLCTVMLLRAMLRSDPGKAALAASALTPVFSYVGEGDGFYLDGSFIQHSSVPYQGGYGAVLLSGLATLFTVLRGSPWEVTSQLVFDSVEKSFAPFIHDGFCMDLVRGRGISRRPFGDHRKGREIAASILLLGESASYAERKRWRGMVKGWAQRGGWSDPILRDDSITALEEPDGHVLMPMSARAVHRRSGWCAGLSMASDRIGHYEHGNHENLRGWHTGSGMLYWWAEGHGDQYSDHFWSTVDPYRLPGTTVSTKRLADGAGEAWGDTRPPGRWVGGASDGTYAAVGQHLNGLESTMEAFKSWFFLDDAVLCLGAGITGHDGVPVETIVDNRRTSAVLTVDGRAAHLAGHGGYVLLDGADLRRQRTERYVTLWLDHGVDPDSAGYAYLLLPGASLAETMARAAAPGWVSVLANTAFQQGIHVPSLGLTAVNFWIGGAVGGLTASGPCSVLIRENRDGTASLTVSDPRRDLSEVTLGWDRTVAGTLVFTGLSEGSSKTVTVRLR